MKKILPLAFLINLFAFGQQEIPFSNKKDEFVKLVSYTDGGFSIVTSNSVNWGKTISRLYDSNRNLISEISLPAKVGLSCTINGFNNLQFPEMTAYHPELKLTVMLGGVSGPILPPQMVCRILNEKGQFTDVQFHNFKETNHKLIACEVYEDKLLVVYSSGHILRDNKSWLAVIDLKNKTIRELEIASPTGGIGSYIGFRAGRFYFLLNENNYSILNNVNQEAKLEQIPVDFPQDPFSRQKYSSEKANRVVVATHPVKYYGGISKEEICFILYGKESFICKISPENELFYQSVQIPDSIKVVRPLMDVEGFFDFRKAIIVETKKGTELLISTNSGAIDKTPCSLGRWKIEWDYVGTAEPIEILKEVILGTPLDMIAYSGRNPRFEEWKEAQEGALLLRTLEDFQGTFSFMEFSNRGGKIPTNAILYK